MGLRHLESGCQRWSKCYLEDVEQSRPPDIRYPLGPKPFGLVLNLMLGSMNVRVGIAHWTKQRALLLHFRPQGGPHGTVESSWRQSAQHESGGGQQWRKTPGIGQIYGHV